MSECQTCKPEPPTTTAAPRRSVQRVPSTTTAAPRCSVPRVQYNNSGPVQACRAHVPNVAHKIIVHDLQWLWDDLYRVDPETCALHPLLSSEEPALLQQALEPCASWADAWCPCVMGWRIPKSPLYHLSSMICRRSTPCSAACVRGCVTRIYAAAYCAACSPRRYERYRPFSRRVGSLNSRSARSTYN